MKNDKVRKELDNILANLMTDKNMLQSDKRIIAITNRSNNEQWLSKKQQAHQELENDPEFIAKRQQGIDLRTKNKIGREKQLEGIKRRNTENTEWQKNKKAGTRRSLAKPCITPFGVFFTGADAGRKYNELNNIKTGINRICKFLKNGKEGYKYITIEEYIMLTGKEI